MKRKQKILFLVCIAILLSIPTVLGKEQLEDGWHIVVANSEEERGKDWNLQNKEWAYYEGGKEIMRYSRLIGSHRGWGTAPENSLASFKATREKGYYAFETDVHFTKDNVPVLIHDATINSTARNNDLSVIAEDTYVKNLTYNQLKNNYIFNIERINHGTPTVLPEFNTNRITSFEEMLDYVKANKMHVSIELKTGTKEQIESMVRMTQEKNMHNYVRWISFYTDLLKYVRDYDPDESLSVTASSSCDTVHNLYCGQDTEYYIKKLKTDTNALWITNNPVKMPAIACAINLPLNEASYPANVNVKPVIPQGTVKVNTPSIDLIMGKETYINYQYNGDGTVKCIDDPNTLTCVVDSKNNRIQLKSVGTNETQKKIYLYATQGISHSASEDAIVTVNIEDEKTSATKHVKNISIDGYSFAFDNKVYDYKMKIKKEEQLKINVNMDSNQYTHQIDGNQNLKDGSQIVVNILNLEGKTVVSYRIVIEKEKPVQSPIKETIVKIPDTFSKNSNISMLLAIIFIAIGLSIFGYHYMTEKRQ